MARITVTFDVPCTPGVFWKNYLDSDFMTGLFRHLRFTSYEILERRDDGADIVRRSKGEPPLDAPAVVRKLIGPKFGYVEEGRWSRATGTWAWRTIPGVLADRTDIRGTMWLEDTGAGRSRMRVDATVEVRLLGLGGLIEATAGRELRDGWGKTAEYFRECVASGAIARPSEA